MAKPRKIHLSSRCHIRGFAVDDHVAVRGADDSGGAALRRVGSVGWRTNWWGSDGQVSEEVETTLQRTENKAGPILREIEKRWPLGREDRADMAQFVAIHSVRGPAWRQAYDVASMQAMGEELRQRRYGDRVERMACAEFVAEQLRAAAMLKDVPRIGSILMSMCWALVKFDQPLIGSCDQPVVWYPLLEPGQHQTIKAIPRSGFMDTVEVRFPIDSWRALLLTWAPQPDLDQPAAGEFRHAADINRSTLAQVDEQWFYRPGTHPPFLAPPLLDPTCAPISYGVIPGYSFEIAATSRRRSEANRLVGELISGGATNEMKFVVVTSPSAVSSAS